MGPKTPGTAAGHLRQDRKSPGVSVKRKDMYIAIIATLLIALHTGSKPNTYDYSLMHMVAVGLVPLDEALVTLHKRRAERARAATQERATAKNSR